MRVRSGLISLLVLASAALGACNMVVTKTPLFSAADESPLKFRSGLWASINDPCTVDESKPFQTWPDCANAAEIRGREFRTWDKANKVWKADELKDLLIAEGEPLVLQVRFKASDSEAVYMYAGLEAKLDDQRRIIGLKAWPVLCGPPPPEPKPDDPNKPTLNTAGVTKAPFPGIVMEDKGPNCTTTQKHVLRKAARLSRQFAASQSLTHWVRDEVR